MTETFIEMQARHLAEMRAHFEAAATTDPLTRAVATLSAGDLMRAVAERHGITVDEMKSPYRGRTVGAARDEAIYLLRQLRDPSGGPALSYSALGSIFQKDHSSVSTAVRRFEKVRREMRAAGNEPAFLTDMPFLYPSPEPLEGGQERRNGVSGGGGAERGSTPPSHTVEAL